MPWSIWTTCFNCEIAIPYTTQWITFSAYSCLFLYPFLVNLPDLFIIIRLIAIPGQSKFTCLLRSVYPGFYIFYFYVFTFDRFYVRLSFFRSHVVFSVIPSICFLKCSQNLFSSFYFVFSFSYYLYSVHSSVQYSAAFDCSR